MWPSLLSQIEIIKLIDSLAAFFGPIFGVIIADYYLVKKEKVNHKDLFFIRLENEYIYSGGWNYKSRIRCINWFYFFIFNYLEYEFRRF